MTTSMSAERFADCCSFYRDQPQPQPTAGGLDPRGSEAAGTGQIWGFLSADEDRDEGLALSSTDLSVSRVQRLGTDHSSDGI